MKTREEALAYALSFPKTYQEAPFHDNNWQLVRVEGSKKVFLWTYEREGYINLNVKADPQWRDFWRSTYASVIPGWHQNKDHWNTIILDGTVPEQEIQRMIVPDPPDDDAKVPADRAVPISVCQCNRWLVSDRNTVHNHDTKISYQND